ncbi:hypothetical protein GH714_004507 [Hevea brasiliensis]|uniref:XS domain-containing protein n=1 Tax=Hevea brasiliensis TaxID=3981 RepID=A0A6A6KYX8_HEVBR|nr:hypothetical protein GH714_004507 [Hevea brasiliensis]
MISADSRYSGKIAAEGRGPQISTPSAWERPKLMYKLGMQINSNAKTNQNADSKNYSSCGNEFSSQQSSYFEQGQIGSAPQVGSPFGRWQGLNERVKDYEIVWPPMVVIMNTRYEQEENGKYIGMGNRELLDHFKTYTAVKARHSYGPQGHRGISVLIFDDTAAGYLEAVRLHKHFKEQGRETGMPGIAIDFHSVQGESANSMDTWL